MATLSSSAASQAEKHERPIRAGVFSSVGRADEVVMHLMDAGFTSEHISVLCSDPVRERHFRRFEHQKPAGTYTPAAAAVGTAVGAAVGGLVAVAGLVTTGGIAVLAAGALATWAGGVVGGLIGAMMTRGVEHELANYYDQALTAGKILVAVEDRGPNHDRRLDEAEKILAEGGAEPMPLPEG
jgi:hypothetical protein